MKNANKMKVLKKHGFIKSTLAAGRLPKYRNLWECYGRHRYEKEKAYDYCISLVNDLDGYAYGIASYSIMQFTFSFKFDMDSKTYRAWITKDYNRYCEVVSNEQ